VYDFINRVGGATDEEIEEALSISGNTVRPTRGSLVKDGFIVDSGLERLTKAGNPAIVWRVA
jgi:transcription initiation factor IIE alpha subunit